MKPQPTSHESFDLSTRIASDGSTIDPPGTGVFRVDQGSTSQLSPNLIRRLKPFFRKCSFAEGEHLIRQGEDGDQIFVLISGKVKVFSELSDGQQQLIDRSGPGDLLGEMALVTGESRTAHVVAEEPVNALSLDTSAVHSLARTFPELSQLMTNLVARRLGSVQYDALAGKTMSGYRLKQRLGKGGMAVVYEAECPITNRSVAVKMMSHRLVSSESARKQFDQEFELVRTIDSPFIAKTFSRFEAFKTYFIVMEFCAGRSLAESTEDGPVPEWRAREIYHALQQGLAHAHARGIVHRDIKPSNIMATVDGAFKLTDFGLACTVDDPEQLAQMSGTVGYLAPELLDGEPASAESDYFSAGMTMLEQLLGHRFFPKETVNEVAYQLRRWKAPNLAERFPALSPEFAHKVQLLLKRAPEDRRFEPLES